MKRQEIIEILKPIKPLLMGNNGPTSFFIVDKGGKKVNISTLSVGKGYITVTIGRNIFKRKYRINRDEL